MVKASEFVANEPLLALVQDAAGNTASVSAVQNGMPSRICGAVIAGVHFFPPGFCHQKPSGNE